MGADDRDFAEMANAIERVRKLHSPWPPPSLQDYCRTCAHPMPCPTRQALDEA